MGRPPYLGALSRLLYVRDDPQSQGRGDRPGAGRLAELAQHRRDMVPDGFLGQEEPLRDFGVGKALAEQAEYLHRIRQLLAHPMMLEAFSAAAADRARSRYSWDRIAHAAP